MADKGKGGKGKGGDAKGGDAKGKGGDAKGGKGGDAKDAKGGKGGDAKGGKGGDAKGDAKGGKGGDAKGGKGDAKGGKAEEKGGKADEKKDGEKKEGEDDGKEKVVAKPKKIKEEKAKSSRRVRKEKYRNKLKGVLAEYQNALIVTVDNVGSHQLQKIRLALRKNATVLMGKNTIIRKVIRELSPQNPKLEAMLPYIVGNMGFIFTNSGLQEARKVVSENKVPAVAKTGTHAPADVFVPPGPTGLDPAQTSFFQALNIATKIARGSIEIVNQVHLIKKGEKISASAVALLTKLDVKPFFYGVVVTHVYEDGVVYSADVLDLTQEDLFAKWFAGVRTVAALSLGASYPTTASLPAYMHGGFRKLLAVSMETDYLFAEAKAFKEQASKAPAPEKKEAKEEKGGKKGGKPEPKKVEEEEKKEEEDDGDIGLGGGLFGNDD
jgi:large subunit ribosomal protein LP0